MICIVLVTSYPRFLEENGFVVFCDVGSASDVSQSHDLFWSHLERVSRNKVSFAEHNEIVSINEYFRFLDPIPPRGLMHADGLG